MAQRAVDVVNVDTAWGEDATTKLIKLLAQYKGLRTDTIDIRSDRQPTIHFKEIQAEGLWSVIEFISEVRPCPDVLPPDTAKRALIRSLTERVLYSPYSVMGKLHLLYRHQGEFRPPTTINLLDLAITARCDPHIAERYPWARTVARACQEHVARSYGREKE